jgi:hypothetical protein
MMAELVDLVTGLGPKCDIANQNGLSRLCQKLGDA